MKKLFLLLLSISLLSGCSFVGEVNDTLQYVNDTTEYIQELNTFAEELPQLVETAATDSAEVEEIEGQISSVVETIEEYNDIAVPEIAQDVHSQIVEKNELLQTELNQLMENGKVAIDQLENTTIIQTITEMNTLLDTLQQLGE